MVLYAASHLPERHRVPHEASWRRGWAFLQKGIDAQGRVAAPDGTADYPTYATAMTLTAIRRFGWQDVPAADLERMKRYLLDSQLTEKQGWTRDDPCYGGWDHIGHTPGAKRLSTGADISVTRFAAEAFADHGPVPLLGHGWTEMESSIAQAWLFSSRCTNAGGRGFFFTPDRASRSNKAGWVDADHSRPRPYGSATVDGMLIGYYMHGGDAALWGDLGWLLSHQKMDKVSGFSDADESWSKGLRYYYWSGLAKYLAMPIRHISDTEKMEASVLSARDRLSKAVQREQRRDGSWASESAKMREDDPLVATSFALIALGTGVR